MLNAPRSALMFRFPFSQIKVFSMSRNIKKKHRFRVADAGGRGVVGSSDTKIAEGPQNSAPECKVMEASSPGRNPAKSCVTDRKLGRFWNVARNTLMLSYSELRDGLALGDLRDKK